MKQRIYTNMSHGTKRQKNKKNFNRPKAGDIGYVSSIQRNYKKKVNPVSEKQLKLI